MKRSGVHGTTARESATINQSLLTLGRVITALVTKLPHVPYRDSKLTRLLKDTLGGNSKTLMIATISPSNKSQDETLSTLQYAVQASCIVNSPRQTEHASVDNEIRRLSAENERLLVLLRATHEAVPKVRLDEVTELTARLAESEQERLTLKTQLAQSREADARLRSILTDKFDDILDTDPPVSGISTALLVVRKLNSKLDAQTKEAVKMRAQLSNSEISQMRALACDKHNPEVAVSERVKFEAQAEVRAAECEELAARCFTVEQERNFLATRIDKLRAFDSRLLDEVFNDFGPAYLEADRSPGHAEGSVNNVTATSGSRQFSCHQSGLTNSRRDLRLRLVRSEAETQRLCAELSNVEARIVLQKKRQLIHQDKLPVGTAWSDTDEKGMMEVGHSVFSTPLAQLQGEYDALATGSGVPQPIGSAVYDDLYSAFNTLLWSEVYDDTATVGCGGDIRSETHSGISEAARAIRLLRNQLHERSEEVTRLSREMADLEVDTATQHTVLQQELHEARKEFDTQRSDLSARLADASRDRTDLVAKSGLLHTEMLARLRQEESTVAWHQGALQRAVATRNQATNVVEEALAALSHQKVSEGRASKEFKRAVSAAAAEFSRRLTKCM